MFSTVKFLKTGKLLTNYLCHEGAKGFHMQVVSQQGRSLGNKWLLLKRNQTAVPYGLAGSFKFESTDAKASVLDSIPEPPPLPPPTPSIEQISQWIESVDNQVIKSGNCLNDKVAFLDMNNQPSQQNPGDYQILQELEILPKEQTSESTDAEVLHISDESSTNVNETAFNSFDESLRDVNEVALHKQDIFKTHQENVPMEVIPEPPVVPQDLPGSIYKLAGEPTFESLGLGGWSPVGIIQNCMEFLHVTCDLPWWGSIVIGTVVVRTLMFPLVIVSQRNAAKMNNHLPEMQLIQLKLTEARQRGDRLDAARYANEMMFFMREKGLNPIKNLLVPLAQAPLFISFFMGLRKMANLPVESLKVGGLYWFADLTVPDQFYLLPIITCATLAITIEVGTDTARLNSSNMGLFKYLIRALPLVVFPFTINFPSAILVYWASSNFISLLQVATLRIPRVREYFNIEQLIKHNPKELPVKDEGFVKGVKESWTNLKITKELEDRQRADEINFIRSGRGPIRKTFKYDPTKPILPNNMVHAKKRND
ncbi:mitochondrial inner membrane protein OXA1L isoform X3 [Cimex lectularius]|uniref:Membrane insertase YidC/Oxa/ALB C-terminal domain-containing protein n=1 Tax=Cimex lectularius TaxID=79782 RepID=A0A8I6RJB8_CIMLE|nr:mitochondrial inner membrane protein OXA1L isoform X3 [Cimex lectularius]